mgnify:CR=1 FL=1
MDNKTGRKRGTMLKIYSKNDKTIILDIETCIWARMETSFYEENKDKKEFWSFLYRKYFDNCSKNDHLVDTIYFAITKKCNLNCEFCAMSSNNNIDISDEIDIHILRKKLPALLTPQIKKVVITGGEPFENKQLFEILKLLITYISKEKIILQTNALLLDKDKILKLKKYIGAIEISIENIVLELSLKKYMENIFKIINEQNIQLSLSYVVTENNMKYFKEGLELARQYNTFFLYRFAEPFGGGIKILEKFQAENTYKNTLKIELEVLDFIVKNQLWDYRMAEVEKGFLLPNTTCGAYADILAIQPNGLIYPCINIQDNKFQIGNIKEDPLEELKELLKITKKRERNIRYFNVEYKEKCQICFYKYFCNGFCGAYESEEGKDMDLYKEYICKIRQTYLYFEMFCVDNTYNFQEYIQKKKEYLLKCLQSGRKI